MSDATMDRRAFLKTTGAFAGLSALAAAWPSSAAANGPNTGRIYKAIKFQMFSDKNLSVLEKFKALKEIGYDGVEVNAPDKPNFTEILAASKQTGLPVSGVVDKDHWNVRLSDPDENVRRQAVEDLLGALEEAHSYGASSVLLVPGKVADPKNENHEQVWQRSIAGIRAALPTASRVGVRILIENVWNGFCYDPKQLAAYIDEIASPWVGVHFDIGNHIKYGKPADWINVLGNRIVKLDVKDWSLADEKAGRSRGFCEIGEGDADWPAVREALGRIGYSGWAAAEVRGGDRQRMAVIAAQMDKALGI